MNSTVCHVRSALHDLWHEGCGRVADKHEAKLSASPSAINHAEHNLPTLSGMPR